MHALYSYKTLRAVATLLFSGDIGSTTRRENKEDERENRSRVDRNKRSDITRDRAQQGCNGEVAF